MPLNIIGGKMQQTQKELMGEIKIAESQSRYGIMDELSNKKIHAKEKLAKLEKETDQVSYESEKLIGDIREGITQKEQSYEREHAVWKGELTIQKEMAEKEHKRKMDSITAQISQLFFCQSLILYQAVQQKAIEEQKSIIEEIDASIKNLKEMSAEQKKD